MSPDANETTRNEPALLPILQSIIERSYRMSKTIEDAARFLIGDEGLRRLYGDNRPEREDLPEYRGAGARLLVRPAGGAVRAALYYPDAMVRHLEAHDPRRGLDDRNIDAFAVLIEELDHLLTLASRVARGRPTSLLELEIHAGVTKYLLVVHFLGRLTGRRRVSEFHRLWARHHLFEKYAGGEGEETERYRAAARMAGRYVAWLDSLLISERRDELRRFHLRSLGDQVRLIDNLG